MSVELQNKTVAEQEKSREIEEKPILCKWCGGETHHVGSHFIGKKCSSIPKEHENKTPNELMKIYVAAFPEAPTMSAAAAKRLKEHQVKKKEEPSVTHVGYAGFEDYMVEKVAVHEILGLDADLLKTASGEPLRITVNINKPFPEFVPKANPDYVFGDIELLKDVLMMIEMRIPGYLWGHAGTGKSTLPTQLCARLNRPIIRSTPRPLKSRISAGKFLCAVVRLISSQVFWQVQCVTGGFICQMNMISRSRKSLAFTSQCWKANH